MDYNLPSRHYNLDLKKYIFLLFKYMAIICWYTLRIYARPSFVLIVQ